MNVWKLRRRCEARLRELELPIPFDVKALAERLGARRGRPIMLCPAPEDFAPSGAWIASSSADYIFYQAVPSALHQEHIILHELSHLLSGHEPVAAIDTDLVPVLFPNVRADAVRRMLGRTSYSTEEEREAELLASLLMERISDRAGVLRPTRNIDPTAEASLRRLEGALEEGEPERC